MAQQVFESNIGLTLAVALLSLRVMVTLGALRAGAQGGLLTPGLSIGALLGIILGGFWNYAWPGVPLGAFAIVGSAAFLASVMKMPLTAVVHDFEETFIILEGQIATTFRGEHSVVRTGETVNIPANAPHQFRNSSANPVRMLCICSPAGQENFFREVGIPVTTRTTPPPAQSTKRNRRHSEPNLKDSPRNIGRRYFDMHEIFRGFQNEV